jgi:hypothetical protein
VRPYPSCKYYVLKYGSVHGRTRYAVLDLVGMLQFQKIAQLLLYLCVAASENICIASPAHGSTTRLAVLQNILKQIESTRLNVLRSYSRVLDYEHLIIDRSPCEILVLAGNLALLFQISKVSKNSDRKTILNKKFLI